ncbi:MAG: TolC family protein [Ignavibacteria bacterium]|jgi:outer membrane protein TolC|nr:TolC family protein [Ignavibacteria bacterium]
MNIRQIKKVIKTLIILALLTTTAYAQRSITLDEAIKIAIKNSYDLQLAKLDIQKAEATVDEVYGNALPSIDLTANFAHSIKKQVIPMTDFGAIMTNAAYGLLFKEKLIPEDDSKYVPVGTMMMSMAQDNTAQAQLQLTQILFNSAVFTGIGAAKDYLDVSKAQYNQKVADIELSVKNAFYGILYARELLSIINISYQNAQDNLANVTAMNNQGLVSEFTLLDATVRVENIKPQIKQLENAVASATNGLKMLLAIPQTDNVVAQGAIEYVDEDISDVQRTISQAKENNRNIKLLETATQINKAQIDVAESGYYPSLVFFGNYAYTAMSNTFSDWTTFPTSQVGLSLSMNLFKGNQTKYQAQEARIDLLKTQEQILQLKDAIDMQVRNNIDELLRIKEDIAAQERNIGIAERAYALSVTHYKEGTGNQLEVANSDLALSRAKTNKLESVYNYIINKAKLDNLLGITITND